LSIRFVPAVIREPGRFRRHASRRRRTRVRDLLASTATQLSSC
jgi:hypothetical protein